eukprot:TRINITY_DN44374_c0_g1_i1.p1 TRINITY_DN44374_c0_g1~~TRINITY_DN44374_c0_g1_i1.p1  ORF type:complete len:300 (-),score=72.77 TRINITY_DN44374_c0_g1_i1:147-1046(-)
MAEDPDLVGFTVTIEGSTGRGPKHFSVVPGSSKAIRIGRAPGNDVQIELRGASQYHAELRLLAAEDEDSHPRLVVRDISMNGTGLRRDPDKPPVQVKKDKEDTQIFHGTEILVPFHLKATQRPEDRAWMRVTFDDAEIGAPPGEGKQNGAAPRTKESDDKDGSDDEDGEEEDEEDGEKTRMQFVDLLMKTREISAGTTYQDAEEILSKKPQWRAVDEQTRKECFDIFVEHLGSHSSSKKKKKDKEKGKTKKRKHKGSDDEEEEEEEEREKKKSKKEKKGRSGSRGRRGDRKRRAARSDS